MRKVLVADDEAEILELIGMILGGDRVDILTAHDGLEALRIAREELPDLVLADVMMPRMGGLELTSHLREDPETRDTIVLLMSAARRVDVEAPGAMGLIRKPFDIGELVATVRRHLGNTARVESMTSGARRLTPIGSIRSFPGGSAGESPQRGAVQPLPGRRHPDAGGPSIPGADTGTETPPRRAAGFKM